MATAALTAPPSTRTRERSRLAADLLAVAWEPGAAPPREVRVRPELLARLGPAVPGGLLGDPAGVPVVVDAALPCSPGFEVRRVPPR
jgi:hypothetical protein